MEKEKERGREGRETGGGEGEKNREGTVSDEGRLEAIVKRTGGEKEGREEDHGRGKRNKLEHWERRGNVKGVDGG